MFQKQPVMRKVLYSLIPLWLLSVYLYGWRAILMPLVIFPFGIAAEYIMERAKAKDKSKVQVTEAVLVTSALFALSLPPALPVWMGVIGIVFAVIFGKMVFGGFGRNVFNPAITGRVFIYLAFPAYLGTLWLVPGAAANWNPLTLIMEWLPKAMVPDVVTTATTMDWLKTAAGQSAPVFQGASLAFNEAGQATNWLSMFLGFESGSLGETSALLIILAGVYLMFTPQFKKNKDGTKSFSLGQTANYRMILGTVLGAAVVLGLLWHLPQFFPGMVPAPRRTDPLAGLLSGSLLFVAVFMSTDPVSAPKKAPSQWTYGLLIGAVSILVRTFSGFPEGVSFGILVANMFSPLLDETIGTWGAKKPVAAPKAPAQEAK